MGGMIVRDRLSQYALVYSVISSLCLFIDPAKAQQGGFDPLGMQRDARETPFVGVTVDGTPRRGLFDIGGTGVSTAGVRNAAEDFLNALTLEQRARTEFPVDAFEWQNWANIHRFKREGVSLDEMTETQRNLAYNLLRESLSTKGYQTSRDIMRLNHHLAELVDNFEEYGAHLYWITIMGDPSEDEPWGWQIDGHHLVINYFVLGDQIVMTPTFMGSEPVRAETGKYAGVEILQPEQRDGLAFIQALPADLQSLARIGEKVGRSENKSEMFKDNIVLPYLGLPASRLIPEHREKLLDLIGLFVGNMDLGHADIKMSEVAEHLGETYFAWIGETDEDAVFYYRIHSPVVLIEFDHQGPIALADWSNGPTRRHIHTVVRTPNGNDYGKDLLRQHLEKSPHHTK
jgi:hypothetical protein